MAGLARSTREPHADMGVDATICETPKKGNTPRPNQTMGSSTNFCVGDFIGHSVLSKRERLQRRNF